MKMELLWAIVTNECQLRSIGYENIVLGCQQAQDHYGNGNSFVDCIHLGIRTAKERNETSN
jgi:hypothetical protein